MPTDRIIADDGAPAVPADDRNGSGCDYDWCQVDHFQAGWDEDSNGDPVRMHEYTAPVEYTRLAPFLILEEARTPTGTKLTGPYVSFPDSNIELTVEDGLSALRAMLTRASKWREIVAELNA